MEVANLRNSKFGFAWLLMWTSLALHAWDEGAHSFLTYYNATMLTMYGHLQGYMPRMDLGQNEWVALWALVILAGLSLTPWAFRNVEWMRQVGKVVGGMVFLMGVAFLLTQLLGGTVGSVRFDGVGPGVYTAPLLVGTGGYLCWWLKKSSLVGRTD